MSHTHHSTRRPLVALWSLALLAVSWPLWLGCQVQAWVEAKEEIEIALDLDALLRQGKIDKNKAFPGGKVPTNFKVSFPFWQRQTYDLRENKEVKKYRDQIRDIKVKALTYQVTNNSLTIDLPSQGNQLQVFVAKLGTKEQTQFAEIGYLFPIPSGRTGIKDRLYFAEGGQEKIDGLLNEFAIELGLQGKLSIDGEQDQTVPEGALKLTVTLSVSFTVDIKL